MGRITKKHRPRKSIVWEFFRWCNEDESREVYCEICDFRTIVDLSSSTSGMLLHLRAQHNEELDYLKELLSPLPKKKLELEQGSTHFASSQNTSSSESLFQVSTDASILRQPSSSDSFIKKDCLRKRKPKSRTARHSSSDRSPRKTKLSLHPRVVLHDVINTKGPTLERYCFDEPVGRRRGRRTSFRRNHSHIRGDDRKMNMASCAGGSLAPGLDDSSAGSGDGPTGCDEVSVPLSPEQFLSEEMDRGTSPGTPSSQRPESYKLRHNNHLTLVLESLAGDESFMDVTLTAQGKAIKAHKSVLSAVSPYFRSVLKQNPCQHPIIIMPRDVRFDELSNIISYVYKGEMTVAAEDLSSLLKTAEVLQVTGLSPSEGSNGPGGIMSQMQGLPSGVFPSTSTSSASSSSKNGTKKMSKQASQVACEEASHTSGGLETQGKIDPMEFLNADMTCVKEEIQSENEETEEDSTFGLSVDKSEAAQNPPESGGTSPIRSKSVGSPGRSLEDPTGKPFNPGEHGGTCLEEGTSESPPPITPYACPYCLETHRPSDVLHSHLRLKHPSKPSFVCACGRVFMRQSAFADHNKKCTF